MIKSVTLFFVLFFVVSAGGKSVQAQEPRDTAIQASDYALAWSGILPDHPLYALTILRDRIVFHLVVKPEKKLEYYLLQTDKGIYATKLLVDKGKIALATETALKAEHNYTQLVSDYKWMFFYSVEIPDKLLRKIKTAALKHQEVLELIAQQVPEKDATSFLQVKEFSRRNLEELESLRKGQDTQ